jgi:gamma-glutamylaminecyclotransferase
MLIFVYGTLKHGGSNHGYMRDQRFIGEALTAPHFRLYDLGGYPGMVADENQGLNIQGEVWEVDAEALKRLDELEDIEGGEYAREVIPMLAPYDDTAIEGYRFLLPVTGYRDIGSTW